MSMDETILFIGGPLDALPAIGKAFALGYEVMVVDFNSECPGIKWARKYNQAYSLASTYDIDGILRAVFDSGILIDGVIAVACDVGPVVSKVAAMLGCPYIPTEITTLSWDKTAFKQALPAEIVPAPPPKQFGVTCNKAPG